MSHKEKSSELDNLSPPSTSRRPFRSEALNWIAVGLLLFGVVAMAISVSYAFKFIGGRNPKAFIKPIDWISAAGDIAGVGATFVSAGSMLLVMRQLVEAQRLAREQAQLTAKTALLNAEVIRIANAKSCLETLWKQDAVPFKDQNWQGADLKKLLEALTRETRHHENAEELEEQLRAQINEWIQARTNLDKTCASLRKIADE